MNNTKTEPKTWFDYQMKENLYISKMFNIGKNEILFGGKLVYDFQESLTLQCFGFQHRLYKTIKPILIKQTNTISGCMAATLIILNECEKKYYPLEGTPDPVINIRSIIQTMAMQYKTDDPSSMMHYYSYCKQFLANPGYTPPDSIELVVKKLATGQNIKVIT